MEEQFRDYLTGEVQYDPTTSRTHYRRRSKKKDNLFFDSLDDDFYILIILSFLQLSSLYSQMIRYLFPPRKWGVRTKINHSYTEKQSMITRIGQNAQMHRLLLGSDYLNHWIQMRQNLPKWKLIPCQSVIWWIIIGKEVANR